MEACKDWSTWLNKETASHYFNNVIGTLKQGFQIGIKTHNANGGSALDNPVAELKRVRVKQNELRLRSRRILEAWFRISAQEAAAGGLA